MDRIDRIMCLVNELNARRYPVPIATLVDKLQCSERNVKGIISKLRGMGAPIVYEHGLGYHLDTRDDYKFELPGLWFNASELYALLISHQLLANVQPGWLNEHIKPLKSRIEKILDSTPHDFNEVQHRVRILQIAARPTNLQNFQKVSEALIGRRRFKMLYHGRAADKTTEREVSPQRLIYYRSNWYLDAWCHLRQAIRSFSLDRLHPVAILNESAIDIADAELDQHFTHSYGIFAGQAQNTAKVLFSADAAKWVADEHWHPEQKGSVLPDGRYELKIPYSNPTELIMEILKYGPDAEVLSPPVLREAIMQQIQETAALYTEKNRKSEEILHSGCDTTQHNNEKDCGHGDVPINAKQSEP